MAGSARVSVVGPQVDREEEVLTPEALDFLASLHERFGGVRDELLARRAQRRAEAARTGRLDFLPETREVREDPSWRVAPAPADLTQRWVEITGPTERKMLVNAMNSGAQVWLADFEDANAPTWANLVSGQANLTDAIERRLEFTTPEGKRYVLQDEVATIVVRPRGWHLDERHLQVDGTAIAGALVDFGLYFFHNAQRQLDKGSGPYFYLPKMESHLEARLWNDVFVFAQDALGIPRGTVRATILVETIFAAFEMEEILYELREHASGCNAGRWDYIFSLIKTFRDNGADFMLPDRNAVTMTVPFMRAYTELLVKTCHRRGAFAIGGMAAFIPSRRDPEVNAAALEKVRQDKEREAGDGFDGSWVAHPDLVPVAREVFERVLGARPNSLERQREDVQVSAEQLLDVKSTPGEITEAGLRNDVEVGLRYLESWLRGVGAAGINNLMEDVATAEISRSQVWQWTHNAAALSSGQQVDADLVRRILDEELKKIGEQAYEAGRFQEAREVFEQVALPDASGEFVEFLTLPAYELLD
ncbi:MAG: malate synthase A [Actinomycetota bacterium]|nr:malate synthase A [Actinomycetota bacterium]